MVRFVKDFKPSESGSGIRIIYSSEVRKDGSIEIVESGKEDFQAYIQSFLPSTDISYIIASVNAGDVSVLNRVVGSYGDFTRVPKTYAEFLQLQIDAKNTFDKLPLDVKNKFDNDVNKFMVSAGENEWFDKLGIKFDDGSSGSIVNEEEVKGEE